MAEIFVPAPCLEDARRVIESQDPEVARRAEQRWPGRVWRAAVRLAAAETEHEVQHAA